MILLTLLAIEGCCLILENFDASFVLTFFAAYFILQFHPKLLSFIKPTPQGGDTTAIAGKKYHITERRSFQ